MEPIPGKMNEDESQEFESTWKALFADKEQDKMLAVKIFINKTLEIRKLKDDLEYATSQM